MSADEERPAGPRDPVTFAAGVAKELEYIAEKGFVRTRAGDFACSPRARKTAAKTAPKWWREAEKRAEEAQRNRP